MQNLKSQFKIRNFFFLISLLSVCWLLFSVNISPALAAICGVGFNKGFSCCDSDSCYGASHGQQDCPPGQLCCESCTPLGEEGGIVNPVIGIFGKQKGSDTIAFLLATILRLSLVVAGILHLIYLVIGGIQWLTSGGDKATVAAAKGRLTNAFIGLIIIVLVLVIINLINAIFGLDILHPTLPTPE